MKEGIGIWKLDNCADGNHLKMWNEGAVLLQQGISPVRRKGGGWSTRQRIEPDNGRYTVRLSLVGSSRNAKLNRCGWVLLSMEPYSCHACEAGKAEQPRGDFVVSYQNLNPAPRPTTLLADGGLISGELSRCRYSSENSK